MPFASTAQASVSAVIEDGVDVQARPFTLGSLPAREQFQSPIFAAPSDVTQFFENAGTSLVAQTRTSVTAFVPSGTHVLRQVEAREGLRLSSDAMVIKLDGVEPLAQDAECRRLDGVVEPCAQRAQNRLDVLTRGRPVICDMQPDETGDMRGHCRAGKIDLAEDLLRNGLALRRGE